MNASDSILRWMSRFGLIILVLGALAWGIYHFGERIGLDTPRAKISFLLGLSIVVLLFRYGGRTVQLLWYRHKVQEENVPSGSEHRMGQAQIPRHHTIVAELKHALSNQYGRFWPRKVRILLLTGSAADVEQLTPSLTSQYWQEDSGTVLLWGGDLGAQADSAWLSALRKLRGRPLDGVVWVTSALAQRTTLGQKESKTTLTADMMDSVAQAFAARFELLGWRLPLYIWSLHADDGADRITQSVGCLLPAGCNAGELSTQLAGLLPSLIEQGTQQISSNTQHPFLLQLADQLARQPDSVAGPLTSLLNPYRPSPLVYIVNEPAPPSVQVAFAPAEPPPPPRWKAGHGFVAGLLLMAVLVTGGFAIWQSLSSDPLREALLANASPLPTLLTAKSINELKKQTSDAELGRLTETVLQASGSQLEQLAMLPPLWAQMRGDALLSQAQQLWPASQEVKRLNALWQQQREAGAAPLVELEHYALAQERLRQLAERLNSLDEKKRGYMTVSELKSVVFAIQQPLAQTLPLEELLRQYQVQSQSGQTPPSALRQQIDSRFAQLLNRYALLTLSDTVSPSAMSD
ncbi:membrane protein [Yersinia similis]|uniref:Membrane protein n=1 Tax=Yersinia similis TaxID=367190 RepID=A0ABM5PUY8_9GAMM|nr:VasL domain-containing protein [Yersinia similis]AHK18439.1 membrane protein [Yersinia similis]CFQ70820.1 ImpA domain-containing protein [Yersinia similis]